MPRSRRPDNLRTRRTGRALRAIVLVGVAAALFGAGGLWSAGFFGGPPEADRAKLPNGAQRAFPGAEGHGAAARGGRGGRAIFVTSLAEFGEGTLRACVEASGPRTCVFRTSGAITLDEGSLVVEEPFLTIAGETAPGDGIAIRNGPEQARPSLAIMAHDVIVRHVRLRPGPHAVPSCCSGAVGLYGDNARDIILDHISASWGSDETIDSEGASNVTIQWSIVSEPLLHGGPGKRNRARNMLLTEGGNISVHHNLFALGIFRNPQIAPSADGSTIDVVNNVLYAPRWDYVISLDNRWTVIRANVIGNYKMAGERVYDDRLVHLFDNADHDFVLYLADNYDETYLPEPDAPVRQAVAPDARLLLASEPFALGIAVDDAQSAFARVLADAGATRPARDAVDRRVVEDVRQRGGALLETDPQDVGGWPDLRAAPPPADADGDGMPDAWELREGLDPDDPRDAALDADGDGWTNLEAHLHDLAGERAPPRASLD